MCVFVCVYSYAPYIFPQKDKDLFHPISTFPQTDTLKRKCDFLCAAKKREREKYFAGCLRAHLPPDPPPSRCLSKKNYAELRQSYAGSGSLAIFSSLIPVAMVTVGQATTTTKRTGGFFLLPTFCAFVPAFEKIPPLNLIFSWGHPRGGCGGPR